MYRKIICMILLLPLIAASAGCSADKPAETQPDIAGTEPVPEQTPYLPDESGWFPVFFDTPEQLRDTIRLVKQEDAVPDTISIPAYYQNERLEQTYSRKYDDMELRGITEFFMPEKALPGTALQYIAVTKNYVSVYYVWDGRTDGPVFSWLRNTTYAVARKAGEGWQTREIRKNGNWNTVVQFAGWYEVVWAENGNTFRVTCSGTFPDDQSFWDFCKAKGVSCD